MDERLRFVFKGRSKDLGDGFFVHRALPNAQKRLVGPFIFWDHMGPAELGPDQELVVRAHPHIGLSTITYLFSGHITHRDSLGNKLDIKPGEVNWMTAGEGISHSERIHKRDTALHLEGIQLWVALPEEHEEAPASFVHRKETELPMIDHQGFRLRLIAGEALDHRSPLPVYSPLFYLNGQSSDAQTMRFPVASGHEAAVYVVSGELKVGDEVYDKFTLAIFGPGQDVEFETLGACEFMILGGEIFENTPHIWWNFVSHRREKIEAAKERWRNDQFGTVIDENQRIPLPEQ